ncbi:MAG: hypothetical protein K2H18_06025, partial [Muribaculaceae bacterium]|nr:hypothetical protein [Muribaculaceae bacterium]
LLTLSKLDTSIPQMRKEVETLTTRLYTLRETIKVLGKNIEETVAKLQDMTMTTESDSIPDEEVILEEKRIKSTLLEEIARNTGIAQQQLDTDKKYRKQILQLGKELEEARTRYQEWDRLYRHFGGSRFRTLVQSYILRPLLRNANQYLRRITDRFTLTCSDRNEQLSILVLDRYNKNKVRSATVLSGGERFMISLALSLALSSMNKPGLNVDILFIDEGFGTLDAGSLNAVIDTLRRLPEIAGQNGRRVGVISHREELADSIEVAIKVERSGEGRSKVVIRKP